MGVETTVRRNFVFFSRVPFQKKQVASIGNGWELFLFLQEKRSEGEAALGMAAVEGEAFARVVERPAIEIVQAGGGDEAFDFREVAHGILYRCIRAEVKGERENSAGLEELGQALHDERLRGFRNVLEHAEGNHGIEQSPFFQRRSCNEIVGGGVQLPAATLDRKSVV